MTLVMYHPETDAVGELIADEFFTAENGGYEGLWDLEELIDVGWEVVGQLGVYE